MSAPDAISPEPRRISIWLPRPMWIGVAAVVLIVTAVAIQIGIQLGLRNRLERLPGFQHRKFRSEPYIRAATALQKMGRHQACGQIMDLAKRSPDAEQVFILCRLLFTKRATSEFRRPEIGAAAFLAGTSYTDWPLEPIELIDGVPFVITWGYKLGGEPETAESYLRYCMDNCDWSTFEYRPQSQTEIRTALSKLLDSSNWRRPLNAEEHERLSEQIE